MTIDDFLAPADVLPGLAAQSKRQLLQVLAGHAARATGLDEGELLAELTRREGLGSTGIGQGIAIPHTSPSGLSKPYGLLARLARAVDFEAIDEQPVDLVFLLLTPDDRAAHLKVLALVARQLRDAAVKEKLRTARDAETMYAAITAEVA